MLSTIVIHWPCWLFYIIFHYMGIILCPCSTAYVLIQFIAQAQTAALLLKLCEIRQQLTEPDVTSILTQYGEDLPTPELLGQELRRWYVVKSDNQVRNITHLLELADKDVYPNIHTLLLIAATLPSTTCECERSFSALRRLNNYLRSSMNSSRLDSLALINIHCGTVVDTDKVINLFSRLHPRRMELSTVL